MNREEKRALVRKLKAKGYSKVDIDRMVMVKEMMNSSKNLQEGQKVRLNIERLRADVNWSGMNPRYKEWVEAHAGEVFTVKYHPEYSPSRVCLEECDAVEDWLFWDGDLEVVDEPQD